MNRIILFAVLMCLITSLGRAQEQTAPQTPGEVKSDVAATPAVPQEDQITVEFHPRTGEDPLAVMAFHDQLNAACHCNIRLSYRDDVEVGQLILVARTPQEVARREQLIPEIQKFQTSGVSILEFSLLTADKVSTPDGIDSSAKEIPPAINALLKNEIARFGGSWRITGAPLTHPTDGIWEFQPQGSHLYLAWINGEEQLFGTVRLDTRESPARLTLNLSNPCRHLQIRDVQLQASYQWSLDQEAEKGTSPQQLQLTFSLPGFNDPTTLSLQRVGAEPKGTAAVSELEEFQTRIQQLRSKQVAQMRADLDLRIARHADLAKSEPATSSKLTRMATDIQERERSLQELTKTVPFNWREHETSKFVGSWIITKSAEELGGFRGKMTIREEQGSLVIRSEDEDSKLGLNEARLNLVRWEGLNRATLVLETGAVKTVVPVTFGWHGKSANESQPDQMTWSLALDGEYAKTDRENKPGFDKIYFRRVEQNEISTAPDHSIPKTQPAIILVIDPNARHSEVVKQVVEALEKAGVAKSETPEKTAPSESAIHVTLSMRADEKYEKIKQLIEALSSEGVQQIELRARGVVSSDGMEQNAITLRAQPNSSLEELQKIEHAITKSAKRMGLQFLIQMQRPGQENAPANGSDENSFHPTGPQNEQPVSAKTASEADQQQEMSLKVFTLRYAQATEVAEVLKQIYDKGPAKIVPDARTNSVIVTGPEAQLQEIEALLLKLDEAGQANPNARSVPVDPVQNEATKLIAQLQDELAKVRQSTGPNHPKVQELEARLKAARAMAAENTESLERSMEQAADPLDELKLWRVRLGAQKVQAEASAAKLSRLEALSKEGAVPLQKVTDAQAELQQVQASLTAAEIQVQSATSRLKAHVLQSLEESLEFCRKSGQLDADELKDTEKTIEGIVAQVDQSPEDAVKAANGNIWALEESLAIKIELILKERQPGSPVTPDVQKLESTLAEIRRRERAHQLIPGSFPSSTAPATANPLVDQYQKAFDAQTEAGSLQGTSVAELRKRYEAADVASRSLAKELQQKPDAARQEELRKRVGEAFRARQSLLRAELLEMHDKLLKTQRSIEMRERISDQIIQRRVEDLLNPQYRWDNQDLSSRGTAPSKQPPKFLEGVQSAPIKDSTIFQNTPYRSGEVFQQVRPGLAERAGMRGGDVLVELNGVRVDEVHTIDWILDRLGSDPVPFVVVRKNRVYEGMVSPDGKVEMPPAELVLRNATRPPASSSPTSISEMIPPGMRVVPVKLDRSVAQAGSLKPGDRVDVMTTYRSVRGPFTATLLESVEIFTVESQVSSSESHTVQISLLVTPEMSQALVLAQSQTQLAFALRSPQDAAETQLHADVWEQLKAQANPDPSPEMQTHTPKSTGDILTSLQGKWHVTIHPATPPSLPQDAEEAEAVIEGTLMKVFYTKALGANLSDGTRDPYLAYAVQINFTESGNPRPIDLLIGPNEAVVNRFPAPGIAKLNDDVIRLCFDRSTDSEPIRPQVFAVGEKAAIWELRRTPPMGSRGHVMERLQGVREGEVTSEDVIDGKPQKVVSHSIVEIHGANMKWSVLPEKNLEFRLGTPGTPQPFDLFVSQNGKVHDEWQGILDVCPDSITMCVGDLGEENRPRTFADLNEGCSGWRLTRPVSEAVLNLGYP